MDRSTLKKRIRPEIEDIAGDGDHPLPADAYEWAEDEEDYRADEERDAEPKDDPAADGPDGREER